MMVCMSYLEWEKLPNFIPLSYTFIAIKLKAFIEHCKQKVKYLWSITGYR